MKKIFLTILVFVLALFWPAGIWARDFGLGVHILTPDELGFVLPYRGTTEKFYVTVPFHLSDRRAQTWNEFFAKSAEAKITPIVRLSTDFSVENGAWRRPIKRDIVEGIDFLSSLSWAGERIVILFNEPNHAAEWGGSVDPEHYADIAMFTASWLHTQPGDFIVLPAGLDSAAPNGSATMDSLNFWQRVFARQPDLPNWINGWASHSYPNPGFTGSPYRDGKNTLRGFQMELEFLRGYSKQDLPVYITETGWRSTKQIAPLLATYYRYAFDKIWSNPQVRAVTVFLFQGSPGPFAEFSLLNPSGTPTPQLDALMFINTLPQ